MYITGGLRRLRLENSEQSLEIGIRTRRRPMGLDYAAAKDAEVGKQKKR